MILFLFIFVHFFYFCSISFLFLPLLMLYFIFYFFCGCCVRLIIQHFFLLNYVYITNHNKPQTLNPHCFMSSIHDFVNDFLLHLFLSVHSSSNIFGNFV